MRKIPKHIENPFDNIVIDICEDVAPYFKLLDFTPNMITFLSFLFGIKAIKDFRDNNYLQSGIIYMISYIFDCLDGHYARKYNMVTKFGDYFDHIKDCTIGIPITLLLINKLSQSKDFTSIILLFTLFLSMFMFPIHLGCQELYYDKINPNNDSDTLGILKKYCPSTIQNINKITIENSMIYTKYFGCGTFVIIFLLSSFYLSCIKE